MDEQPANPVTSTTVRRVAAQLGLQVSRVRATRSADSDSLGNGNWHVWTVEGHRFVLRRYHTLRTEQDLSYESQVLRHLAARGWSVPATAAGPLAYDGRLWAATRYVAGRPPRPRRPHIARSVAPSSRACTATFATWRLPSGQGSIGAASWS